MIKAASALALLLALATAFPPTNAAQARQRASDLFDFDSASGFAPAAGVITDRHGVIYGTTPIGGTGPCLANAGCGTVYALSPPSFRGGAWVVSVLHDFQGGTDGDSPMAPLVIDRAGAVYGYAYGSPGTVFQLTPPATQGEDWTYRVIYTFANGPDGNLLNVNAPLIVHGGALYGVASGGSGTCGQSGCGSVFRLTHRSDGSWAEKTLYSFAGGGDSGEPNWIAGPDATGAFYVSTSKGRGAVVRISPPATRGDWSETVIAQFGATADKAYRPTNLSLAPDGTIYGTAYRRAGGVVFHLAPSGGSPPWTLTTIADIREHGYGPNSLAFDAAGSLIGAIEGDFDFFAGAVFRLVPEGGGVWTYTRLWNFNHGPDRNPLNVVRGRGGHLFGVLNSGDSINGSLFELR